ncbi:MAG: FAD-binding oxidoreductase, partial [Chloroflexia bacterium]|nr:FAD-binding oxidoreductase [Chloroflexia bacterium]
MSSRLPVTEADVVVIGTGAFGLSAAYHLASLGAGRVVALDQFAPASQSSPRAAGLFKLIQADQTLTRVARLSIEIVSTFAAATGVALPVVLSGSIRLARTPAHAEMIRAEAAAVRGFGIELELIDRAALR